MAEALKSNWKPGDQFTPGDANNHAAAINAALDAAGTAQEAADELSTNLAAAVSDELATRNITVVDAGNGLAQISVGGVPVGPPFTPNPAVWSAISGKPNLITADDVVAPQGMVEFRWILPTSLYCPEPYRHTLCACMLNSDGTNTVVAVVDINHESNTQTIHPVGTAPADDHNAPSVITAPGDPILVMWQHHGTNGNIYYKVGLPDRPDTLVTAPLQVVDNGGLVAYGQVWKVDHLSDDQTVTYYRIYRNTLTEWYLLTEVVDRTTLQVTTNSPGVHLVTGNGSKPYITTATGARDAQVIRVAVGTNPADDTSNSVSWFEINFATGAITSPLSEEFTANLNGTNLPIAAIGNTDLTLLTGTATGQERRLLAARPWPADMGLLTTEGNPLDRPNTSRYFIKEWSGEYSAETTGPPASATGLICPLGASPSYAKSADVPSANGASSIRETVLLKFPAGRPSADWLDMYGQLNDASSTSGWYGWIGASVAGNELKPRFAVNRVGNANHNLTCPNPLSGVTWGADNVWLRTTYTVTPTGSPSRRCTWEQSFDGTTWTEIGYHVGASGALVVEPGAYAWVGARALNRAGGLVVKKAKLEINGATVSDVDFTNDSTGWHGYASSYVDPQSRHWALMGQATVGRTGYGPTIPPQPISVSRDLGLTGGSVWASYYPGAAFLGASVILARTRGANQELVLSHFESGVLREKILRTQPTSQGEFFRPMPPDNGGPLWCWLVNVADYGNNEFYDWESSLIAVRRL